VGLDYALHNRQSQAAAFPLFDPTAIEALKDVGLVRWVDARPTVPHPDPHHVLLMIGTDLYLPA
jgi:hypothetical protein